MMKNQSDTSNGPGSILAQWLMTFNIGYEEPGCNCYRTMIAMNEAGPDKILSDISYWVDTVHESSQHWYKKHKDSLSGKVLKLAIKGFEKKAIEIAIRRACERSLEMIEENKKKLESVK